MIRLLRAFFSVRRALRPKPDEAYRALFKDKDGVILTIDERDLGLALEADRKNAAKAQGALGKDMMLGPFTIQQLRGLIAVAQQYETIDLALVAIAAHIQWEQDLEEGE